MRNADFPNFFIIGAAKAGTTSLYDRLVKHPEVFLTKIKEPMFFCNDSLYTRGVDYYLHEHFRHSGHFIARGEATPHYLCFEKVAQRIKSDIPEENHRFIVILRDPVRRAYSLYWNMVAEGVEDLSFEEALAREPERLNAPDLDAMGSLRYRYLSSGLYGKQIQAYLRYFPKDSFLFLFFDDLLREPRKVMASVYDFLAVSSMTDSAQGGHSNPAGQARSLGLQRFVRQPSQIKELVKPLLPAATRRKIAEWILRLNKKPKAYPPILRETEVQLRQKFALDVMELSRITGRNLEHWLETEESNNASSAP